MTRWPLAIQRTAYPQPLTRTPPEGTLLIIAARARMRDGTYTNSFTLEILLGHLRSQGAATVGIIAANDDDLETATLLEGAWSFLPEPPLLLLDECKIGFGPAPVEWEQTLFIADVDLGEIRLLLRRRGLIAALLVDLGDRGRTQLALADDGVEDVGAATPEEIAAAYGKTRSTPSKFTGWRWPSGRWGQSTRT